MNVKRSRRSRFRIKEIAPSLVTALLLAFGPRTVADTPAVAAHHVLERLIGDKASDFTFEVIPSENGLPVYEYQVHDGNVTVKGNSGVSLCRGAYDYLKKHGYAMLTESGKTVALPAKFPEEALHRVVSPFRFNQAYNVVGYGYTMPFWHWEDWRRELDWLALHGYNLAIAMEGQEGVWERIWKEQGLTDQDLQDFYCGPAYLPWFRMGNINRFMGPLPESWIQGHMKLQHQILAGMKELGIEPVVPAFSGFVPPAFARARPELVVHPHLGWGGFGKQNETLSLDIASPEYTRLLQAFTEAYEEEFGPQKYFLIDCFNEIDVPVSKERGKRLEELANYGKNIYAGITAAEPNGTWVMQGWMFNFDKKFWDKESVKALLSKVPDDRMIILDLANEGYHGWKELDAFYGKQWILSYVPIFGGNDAVSGSLKVYATEPHAALCDPKKGKLVGLGRAEEGYENSEVTFELLSDAAWSPKPIDLQQWIKGYCRSRYTEPSPEAEEAWQLFLKSAYSRYVGNPRYDFQEVPGKRGNVRYEPLFDQGVALFLKAGKELGQNELYRNDAIEFATQAIATRADLRIQDALAAAHNKKQGLCDTYASEAIGAIKQLDTLSAAHPERRLSRWIDEARRWGTTPSESDLYEENVRRLLTVWGGSISDYACRNWSGLLGEYYAGRLAGYFDALKAGRKFDVEKWEEAWIASKNAIADTKTADPIKSAEDLLAYTSAWPAQHLLNPGNPTTDQAIVIGSWSPAQMSTHPTTLEWSVGNVLTQGKSYEVVFKYLYGAHRLDIADVQLVQANAGVVAEDTHEGSTGIVDKNNHYRLALKDRTIGADYVLRAKVRSVGGTDSSGQVLIISSTAP